MFPVLLFGMVAAIGLSAAGATPQALRFEPNLGQAESGVQYIARGPNYTMLLSGNQGRMLLGKGASLRMELRNGAHGVAEGIGRLSSVSNYYLGNDPKRWRQDVPHYGRVKFGGVYPGIDVVYYGCEGRLEYDFVVQPWGDASRIRLAFSGMDSMRVEESGDLVLTAQGQEIRQQRARVYQEIEGRRVEIPSAYRLDGGEVRLALGGYDRTKPLVIDPTIVWSTYLGGPNQDNGYAMAIDPAGAVYLAGTTTGSYPTLTPAQASYGGGAEDVIVSKFSTSGTLVYSTYLGGSGDDIGRGIAVDAIGNAYITGQTNSTNYPALNPAQATLGGGYDAFVTKLGPTGSLVYSTYLGGPNNEDSWGIAVDSTGSATIVGSAVAGFPTLNGYQSTFGGGTGNGLVARFAPGGTLAYATYLGGNGYDFLRGVAVDSSGAAYIAGNSSSTNFPVVNALQSTLGGSGATNVVVVKMSTTGTPVYSTYLGTNGNAFGHAIAVDSSGSAYIGVQTTTGGIPLVNATQPTFGGGTYDGGVVKLSPSGAQILYSTYLGGTTDDNINAIGVDNSGGLYVTGFTGGGFPTLNPSQATYGGSTYDSFVVSLNPAGGLVFSTYLGGSGNDVGFGIAADVSGNMYVGGWSTSTNYPVSGAYQAANAGSADVTVTKLSPVGTPSTARIFTIGPDSALAGTSTALTITLGGSGFVSGATVYMGSTALSTTFLFSGGVSATVPTNLMTAVGPQLVTVMNPGQMPSNAVVFQVTSSAPTPVISTANPSWTYYPTTGLLGSKFMNVTGSNFQSGMTFTWNGTTLTGVIFNGFYSGQAQVTVPTNLIQTPGLVTLTATNPGGSASTAVTFTIPTLRTVASVTPSTVSAGSGPVTITLTGTGFAAGDAVVVSPIPNGQPFYQTTQVVNSTTATATVPAAFFATAQTLQAWLNTIAVAGGAGSSGYYSSNQLPLMVLGCSYSQNGSGISVASTASTGSFTLTTTAGCPYSTVSDSSWLTITSGGSGTGSATIAFSAAANTGGPRTGTIFVLNGQGFLVGTYTVSQAGLSCTSLAPLVSALSFDAGGGAGVLNLNLAGCNWNALSNAAWLTLPTGNATSGTISYNVAANSGTSRVGTITINGNAVATITQGAPVCTYSIKGPNGADPSQGFSPTGGSGSVTVTTQPGCSWSSTSAVPWITINGSGSGVGSGSMGFNVSANTSASLLKGSLTVAGNTFAVTAAPSGTTPVSCTTSAGVPTIARAEGLAELIGDIVQVCTGQATPGGLTANLTFYANTSISSGRLLTSQSSGSGTEVLLLVDEPARPVLGVNAFRGQVIGSVSNGVAFFGVPLVPSGTGSFTRTYRITNLRVNANQLGVSVSAPATVATFLQTSSQAVLVQNLYPQQASAFVSSGLISSVGARTAGPVSTQTLLPLTFTEGFASAFKTKLAVGQDPSVPGTLYSSESGFVNTAAFGAETGVASNGTRLIATFVNVPAGVNLYAPLTPTGNMKAQLVSADLNGAGGYPTLVGSTTIGGINYQQIPFTAGAGTATWEVISADPLTVESLIFNVLVDNPNAVNLSTSGMSVTLSFAPVSVAASSPIEPRFAPTGIARTVNGLPMNDGLKEPQREAVLQVGAGIPLALRSPVITQIAGGAAGRLALNDRDVANPGGTVTASQTILNQGSQTATNVVVGGTLSAGTQIVACAAADGGGSCTYYNPLRPDGSVDESGVPQFRVQYSGLASGQTATYVVTFRLLGAGDGYLQVASAAYSDSPNPADPSITKTPVTTPTNYTLAVSRSSLNFAYRAGTNIASPPQKLVISVPAGAPWSVSNGGSTNIVTSSVTGFGPATVTVSVNNPGSGNLTVSAVGATNGPIIIPVTVTQLPAVGPNPGANPSNLIGVIDQPGVSQTTGFSGAVAVTGWALDDMGVSRISLYRDPVPQDVPGATVSIVGKNLVYVGDAIFLPDTRSDVAGAYGTKPQNYRAGWGMLFLTNTTLNNNGTPGAGGNGTYGLHVIATSIEGYQVELDSVVSPNKGRTITVNNTASLLPFGTIDTPAQGETNVSGAQYVNFGWALTPQPKSIPTDGSTMFVSIDGGFSGRPVYGFPRADIDSLFPGYANTGKAVGYFYINTTALSDGIHSIAWSVRDSGGALQGIGSRVFYVNNTGAPQSFNRKAPASVKSKPAQPGKLLVRQGPDFDSPLRSAEVREGRVWIESDPGERLELHLGEALAEEQKLPICASVDADAGVFFWQPPIMALGDFPVELRTKRGEAIRVLVRIRLRQ